MAERNASIEVDLGTDVKFSVDGKAVTVKGAKGELKKVFGLNWLELKAEGSKIVLKSGEATRKHVASMNSIAATITNMKEGVKKGFSYRLAIVYSHFPMTLAVKGKAVEVNNYFGEKKPRIANIIGNTKVEVKGKEVVVSGIDKEAVGQTAGNLEKATRIKVKDTRVFQDGIYLVERQAMA